jgi:hypothetical protein
MMNIHRVFLALPDSVVIVHDIVCQLFNFSCLKILLLLTTSMLVLDPTLFLIPFHLLPKQQPY